MKLTSVGFLWFSPLFFHFHLQEPLIAKYFFLKPPINQRQSFGSVESLTLGQHRLQEVMRYGCRTGAGTRGRQTMLPEAHFRQVELAYAHCNKTQYEEALLIRIIFIRFPDPQATTFALKQT